jgi:hypothetical protein
MLPIIFHSLSHHAKLNFDFVYQDYIIDLNKFSREIRYFAEINEPEVTVELLNGIEKHNEKGVRKIISNWKNADSSFLKDSYKKLTDLLD